MLLGMAACAAPRPPLRVSDPDPSVKIPAMQKAVREHNRAILPQLIQELDSDDPAVRLYANHALEQLTGEEFGYQYFAGEDQREAAARKWRAWLADPSPRQDPLVTHARSEP
jgi:hypothetical protein